MTDVIILMILIILIGAAVSYIVKEKKNGTRCIGCPAGGNCPSSRKIPKKKLSGPVVERRTIHISGIFHLKRMIFKRTESFNLNFNNLLIFILRNKFFRYFRHHFLLLRSDKKSPSGSDYF